MKISVGMWPNEMLLGGHTTYRNNTTGVSLWHPVFPIYSLQTGNDKGLTKRKMTVLSSIGLEFCCNYDGS